MKPTKEDISRNIETIASMELSPDEFKSFNPSNIVFYTYSGITIGEIHALGYLIQGIVDGDGQESVVTLRNGISKSWTKTTIPKPKKKWRWKWSW